MKRVGIYAMAAVLWAVLAGMQHLPQGQLAHASQPPVVGAKSTEGGPTGKAATPPITLAQADAWALPPQQAAATPSLPAPAKPTAKPKVMRLKVTAYCPCALCCGDGDGVTASGRSVWANGGRFVATAGAVPMGSRVIVPGYSGSAAVPVWDRMGRGPSDRLDVFFPTHRQARQWGVRYLDVVVNP